MIRFVLAFAVLAGAAQAQSVKLQEREIVALLSGNTAIGTWGNVPYRQYFDPAGTTIYVENGTDSALGQWRVQDETYQSIWPGDADWTEWFVMEFAGEFYWVSKTTPPTPFALIEGEQLATP